MSALLVTIVTVGVAVVLACTAHKLSGTTMLRSKFIVINLMCFGSLPFVYAGFWFLADQQPPFDLRPYLGIGLELLGGAFIYGAIYTLTRRDIAPSH